MITETNCQQERPLHAIRRNASGLGGDLWDLVELQLALLQIDSKEAKREFLWAAVAAVGALFVALCALFLLSLALGYLLADVAQFPMWAATATVALLNAMVVAGLVIAMLTWARRGMASLKRSRTELARNLRWLKDVVKNPGDNSSRSNRAIRSRPAGAEATTR